MTTKLNDFKIDDPGIRQNLKELLGVIHPFSPWMHVMTIFLTFLPLACTCAQLGYSPFAYVISSIDISQVSTYLVCHDFLIVFYLRTS